MMDLPSCIYSGAYREGHVQGIAVDTQRGYVYYSFTTMLLKTDLLGNPIGSVVRLAGHLGCITYDAQRNLVYSSLELKHDAIGRGIINRIGYDATAEDAFYIAAFDCDKITEMNVDAENGKVMRAVYLSDVVRDYTEVDEVSGKLHRYGCSGIDGIALGPVFGEVDSSRHKIMVAYGIYRDESREDNDYQVILELDCDAVDKYGMVLNQSTPHHSGPQSADNRYFFYTGNTTYGIQNLEYDPFSHNWYVAVYRGSKDSFDNFPMFVVDGNVKAEYEELVGRNGEHGKVIKHALLGVEGKCGIRGVYFGYGQTGMASLGDGTFYFSHNGRNAEDKAEYTRLHKYRLDINAENLFVLE